MRTCANKNREKALERMRQYYIENKEHRKEYLKQWRKRKPEQEKIRNERAYKKIRQFIDEYKLSKGCSICGYNKSARALEFHHNRDKEFHHHPQKCGHQCTGSHN